VVSNSETRRRLAAAALLPGGGVRQGGGTLATAGSIIGGFTGGAPGAIAGGILTRAGEGLLNRIFKGRDININTVAAELMSATGQRRDTLLKALYALQEQHRRGSAAIPIVTSIARAQQPQ
jgi:hypothetical protein